MGILINTKINMADGSLKNIQDIKQGDQIMGWDFETNSTHPSVVVSVVPHLTSPTSNYIIFDNDSVVAIGHQQTIYCCEFGHEAAIEDLQEGYHTLDINGNEIEILAIHWDVESKSFQQLFNLNSSNNTFFVNDVLFAEKSIEKYRFICDYSMRYMSETIKNLVFDESKDAGCFDFTVSNKDFIRQATPFKYQIQKNMQEINKLKIQINDCDEEIAKNATDNIVVDGLLNTRNQYLNEIKLFEQNNSTLQTEYNKILVQFSEIGEDILLSTNDRRKKYFQRSNKLANENFETYSFFYPKSYCQGEIISDED